MIGNTYGMGGDVLGTSMISNPMCAPMTGDPLGTSILSNPVLDASLCCGGGGCCAAPAVVAKPGLLARLCAGVNTAQLLQPNMCKGISAAAAFFWFVVWVISIISTSIPDWWWWVDSTSGVHEGLWSTCWAHYCIPSNGY
eukprot:RCo054884